MTWAGSNLHSYVCGAIRLCSFFSRESFRLSVSPNHSEQFCLRTGIAGNFDCGWKEAQLSVAFNDGRELLCQRLHKVVSQSEVCADYLGNVIGPKRSSGDVLLEILSCRKISIGKVN